MSKSIKEQATEWDVNFKNITFIVTKDCQLACKYCYLVGKNTSERMSLDMAQNAVDYILNNRTEFNEDAVVWDFIGGEPFIEPQIRNHPQKMK